MKNKIFLSFLLMFSLFSFTGCIDIIEEIFLNKDGSGNYSLKIDMSKMMSEENMGMIESMFSDVSEGEDETDSYDDDMDYFGDDEGAFGDEEDVEGAFGEVEEDMIIEEDIEEDDGGSYADREPMEMDSIFYFKDLPDSLLKALGDKAYLTEKAYGKMQMSESKGTFVMSFHLPFDHIGQAQDFLENIDKLMEDDGTDGEMSGMTSVLGNNEADPVKLFFAPGKFTRKGGNIDPNKESEDSEMDMMMMMFAGGTYQTIYHMPGKVKKMTNENASFSNGKKTVTISVPLTEYFEGKHSMDNTIKYK